MVLEETAQLGRRPDPLFRTEDMDLAEMWDAIQRYQVDFAIHQELTAYFTSREWERARTVMDLGTGNGHYLMKIARSFPDKQYHGTDKSSELIAIAKKKGSAHGIRFSSGDLFDAVGSYDFIIMRLLLQHLSDIDALLDKAASITNPGGSAFVMDAHDPLRMYRPEVPEFRGFFEAYTKQQRQRGLDRSVALRFDERIAAHPKWKLGDILRLILPSTIPGNLDLYRRSYALMIQIVEKVGELDYDFAKVKQEWGWWCGLDEAYTQAGINIIRIDRV